MSEEPKVTIKDIAPGDVYKTLGAITRETASARWELGELPITYVKSRNVLTAAVVPPWLADWAARHMPEIVESLRSEGA